MGGLLGRRNTSPQPLLDGSRSQTCSSRSDGNTPSVFIASRMSLGLPKGKQALENGDSIEHLFIPVRTEFGPQSTAVHPVKDGVS